MGLNSQGYNKKWRKRYPERWKAIAKGNLARCKADPTRWAKYLATRERAQIKYRNKLKREVIDYYGGRCKCCGETRLPFLTIDHINGGGTKHRLSLEPQSSNRKVGGRRFYQLLRKLGFPVGYCVLCWNCNCGRQLNGGKCPHKDRSYKWQ